LSNRAAQPGARMELRMSAVIISLLRNIETIEHIRAAVCAAKEYERELCSTQTDRKATDVAAIAL
jgi:hypothetical protein